MKRSPLRKQRRKKSLRKKLWPEFSKLVRARDKRCVFAGYFGKNCGGNLQASHIYPKGKYPLLELFPLNVVSACYTCHLFGWHKDPMTAARWVSEVLPREWWERLELEKANSLARKHMTEESIRVEWEAFGLGKPENAYPWVIGGANGRQTPDGVS